MEKSETGFIKIAPARNAVVITLLDDGREVVSLECKDASKRDLLDSRARLIMIALGIPLA